MGVDVGDRFQVNLVTVGLPFLPGPQFLGSVLSSSKCAKFSTRKRLRKYIEQQ